MILQRSLVIAVTGLVWAAFVRDAQAGVPRTYTETFSSTQYRDAGQTTADWNTGAGNLSLFSFQSSQTGQLVSANATGVAIDGDYAYISDFSAGLLVVDISDLANPVLVGSSPAVGQAVVASGDYVFLAAGSGGLRVISVANPAAPVLVGSVTSTGANGVAVDGDYAFLADGTAGLRVISISNPAAPSIVATYNTAGSATDVEVDGDYLYLADGAPGFLVFDITNPASPVLLATVDTPANNFGIHIRGNRAYVADSSGLLLIYDLTNRSSPVLRGSIQLAAAGDVFANADRAYVASGSAGISVVDLSDETAPVLLYVHDTTSARDVIVEGEFAYLADGSGGLRIIQVAQNATESWQAGALLLGPTLGVAVRGTLAYVAGLESGLQIVDLSDLGNPVLRSTYDTPNSVTEVAVAGRYAYITDGPVLRVINVFNPDAPFQAASVALPEDAQGIFLDGDHLYLGCGATGLRIYSVSNPTSPTLLGSYNTTGQARGIVVAGDRAYVADASGGLAVFNVANPASPVLVGTYDTADAAYEVAVGGNAAYVAARFSVQVLNVTNPSSPSLLGSLSGYDSYVAALEGNRLYASISGGLKVLDVTIPASPTVLYTLGGSSVFTPAVIGSYALTGGSYLTVRMLRQDRFDASRFRGQSLTLPAASIPIVRARVTATQSGIVNWELTSNGGGTWTSVEPDGSVLKFATGGTDLRWRTTHKVGYPTVDALVDAAVIDWFYESAESDGVADIPNDQGGEVRLYFGRSGYDFTAETATPVTGYQIYSRVDDALLRKRIEAAPAPAAIDTERLPGLASFGRERVRQLDGRSFVVNGERAVGDMPAGTWEALAWVAALQRDQYIARVPTNGDSTGSGIPWTIYCITTHTTTPSIWYASEPDSGYSVDDIAPQVPSGLRFSAPGILAWDPPADEDFAYFSLFGSASPQFDESAVLIAHTIQTTLDVSGSPYAYFHLTATDDADNRSGAATIGNASSGVEGHPALPAAYALHPPQPNPSFGSSQIVFDLPVGGLLTVEVFDIHGRRVRRLPDQEVPAGRGSLEWNGRDDAGREVPGGIYLVRARSGPFEATRRLIRLSS